MSGLSAWSAHVALLAVMLATLAVSFRGHRSDAELAELAAEGSPRERIAALHVLTSRPGADGERFGMPLARALSAESDPLLVEFAGTIGPCRFGDIEFLERRLIAPPTGDVGTWLRQFVFYRRKVGGKQVGGRRRLNLQELSWMLDAMAGRALPNADVLRYVQARESGLPAKFERERQEDQ